MKTSKVRMLAGIFSFFVCSSAVAGLVKNDITKDRLIKGFTAYGKLEAVKETIYAFKEAEAFRDLRVLYDNILWCEELCAEIMKHADEAEKVWLMEAFEKGQDEWKEGREHYDSKLDSTREGFSFLKELKANPKNIEAVKTSALGEMLFVALLLKSSNIDLIKLQLKLDKDKTPADLALESKLESSSSNNTPVQSSKP